MTFGGNDAVVTKNLHLFKGYNAQKYSNKGFQQIKICHHDRIISTERCVHNTPQ